jgi:predicted Zn-dependent peptidase
VYSIHSGNAAFRDSGIFYVYAGSEPAQFGRVVDLTLQELRKVRAHGVTADELARAKDHLKGSLMLSLESTSSRMTRLAKQELYFGHYVTFDEILASIDRVGAREIDALIVRLLGSGPLSLVALGPAGAETAVPERLSV